jgi:hypothetical protein
MAKSSTLSPIDDLTYDVITVLQNKAQALQAYDKYLRDAEEDGDEELQDLFTDMRKQDELHAQVLKEALARRLDDDLGYEDEGEGEEEDEDDEDYDAEDASEVEAPAPDRGESTHATGVASAEPPPGRKESTHRQR